MRVIEQYTQAKSTTTPSEDAVVVTSSYAAVIDGATPKTSFRYPTGETPGQYAARILAQAIAQLPRQADAYEATQRLTAALHQGPGILPCDRPIASCIIYSEARHEVWLLGDCHYATLSAHEPALQHFGHDKAIDHLLADWRRSVIVSYLQRGVMTPDQILADDPGRRIIQPHITGQVRFQNLGSSHRLAYCMLDGEPIPRQLIRIDVLADDVTQLILASDGYPVLLPTLRQSEERLQALLAEDPLCIGPLSGTKGLRPGCDSFDDRSYLSIAL